MENKFNIPNLLSAYRLLALPFLVLTMVYGNRNGFVILLSINLITDILDGLIARRFKMETKLGARLDSVADMGTYLVAVAGMIVLETAFVESHGFILVFLMTLYVLPQFVSILKFRNTTSFHLYSSKIVAYIQGIFMFTFFIWGNADWFFWLMVIASCVSYVEELMVVLTIRELKSNVKSLYFILKTNQKHADGKNGF